jgi:hypothetical protein
MDPDLAARPNVQEPSAKSIETTPVHGLIANNFFDHKRVDDSKSSVLRRPASPFPQTDRIDCRVVILESPAQAQGFWVLEISFVDFEIHLGLHRARLRLVVAVVDSSIRFSGLPTSAVDNVANRSMADPEFSGVMSDESS